MKLKFIKSAVAVIMAAIILTSACLPTALADTRFSFGTQDGGETYYIYGCEGDGENIVIPETNEDKPVTRIGVPEYNTFYFYIGSPNVKSIVIPAGVTSIATDVFDLCSSLESITVDENNENFCDEDGILYNKSKTQIIKIPEGKQIEVYEMPETVTHFNANAMINASLKKVVLSRKIKTIPEKAFLDSDIMAITLPSYLTTVEKNAFLNCDSLKDVYYPGTREDFEYVTIRDGNTAIENADIHFVCTLRFDTGGGSVIPSASYIGGERIIAPANPQKDGFSFVRWEPRLPEFMPDEDLTVSAVWAQGEHNFTYYATTAPTCTQNGFEEYRCTDDGCDEVFKITIAREGHSDSDGDGLCDICGTDPNAPVICDHSANTNSAIEENRTEPTCTREGSYETVIYCSECGNEIKRDLHILKKTDHKPSDKVTENELQPGCTQEGGHDEVVYCSVCEEPISREHFKIPPTGHSDKNSDGLCDECGDSVVETDKIIFNVPEGKEVDYKAKVRFTVRAWNVPEKYNIVIYDGEDEAVKGKNEVTYTSGMLTKDRTFSASLKDARGNVVIIKEIRVTVKTDFFAKLVAFVRRILHRLPTVPLN